MVEDSHRCLPLAAPKQPTRARALARVLRGCAWPGPHAAGAAKAANVLPAGTARRRSLPQEELALIDAMTLLIGPAFAAAMRRSALKEKANE